MSRRYAYVTICCKVQTAINETKMVREKFVFVFRVVTPCMRTCRKTWTEGQTSAKNENDNGRCVSFIVQPAGPTGDGVSVSLIHGDGVFQVLHQHKIKYFYFHLWNNNQWRLHYNRAFITTKIKNKVFNFVHETHDLWQPTVIPSASDLL
jgi:hypothetical protein